MNSEQKKDVFRYISLHSFVRDVFHDYNVVKFTPENFLKSLKNYVDGENEELNFFKNKNLLTKFGFTSERKVNNILFDLKQDSKNKDLSNTKKTVVEFLQEISKNDISGRVLMDIFVVLNASIGIEVDCSHLRETDFKISDKDEQRKVNEAITEMSMKDFMSNKVINSFEVSDAIVLIENSLKNKYKEQEKSKNLIEAIFRRKKNKKIF